MVRRTKAEAQATRNGLLDAAELLFQSQGVSRTSLNQIASAAGTTRGAIYWHFQDKADLFNAMMERVTLPMEDTLGCLSRNADQLDDPLHHLRTAVADALHKTAYDERTRRVFEVATHKVEYVDEMRAVRERHLQVRNACVAMTEQTLKEAAQRQSLTIAMPLQSAALGLHVTIDGLIQNWLLDPQAFDLVQQGCLSVDTHLRGLGFTLSDVLAPRPAAGLPLLAGPGAKPLAPSGLPTPARSRKQTA